LELRAFQRIDPVFFCSTINVLEGLLEYEIATGGTEASTAARKSGEEYLVKRALFRRLATGEPADDSFLAFLYPNRWRYDILRALDYFRASGCSRARDRMSASATRYGSSDPRGSKVAFGLWTGRRLDGSGFTWTMGPASPRHGSRSGRSGSSNGGTAGMPRLEPD
jgi:hypothetical protein